MEGPYARITPLLPLSTRKKAPVAFLDRDGVLNLGKSGYVNAPDEVELLPNAAASLADLKREGYLVCIVTNQSPISRGLWGANQLEAIHRSLQEKLLLEDSQAHIDAFITCPHRFEDRCACRKPSPSMLHLGHRLLREETNVAFDELFNAQPVHHAVDWWGEKPTPFDEMDAMVGDRRTDMGAGWGYGARLFRVNRYQGLAEAGGRVLDAQDPGDRFQP